MQIEIKMDSSVKEPKVLVIVGQMTDEVNDILRRLAQESPQMLCWSRRSFTGFTPRKERCSV